MAKKPQKRKRKPRPLTPAQERIVERIHMVCRAVHEREARARAQETDRRMRAEELKEDLPNR